MLLRNLNTITLKTLKNCAKLYKSRKVKLNVYNSRCLSYCRLLKTILFKFSKVSNSLNNSSHNNSSLNNSSNSHNNTPLLTKTLPPNKLLKTTKTLNKTNLSNKTLKTHKTLQKDSPLKFLTPVYCLYLINHN